MKQPINKNIGKVIYSNYFQDYLVVIDYVDDDNWWFICHRTRVINKAQTPLSHFDKKESTDGQVSPQGYVQDFDKEPDGKHTGK